MRRDVSISIYDVERRFEQAAHVLVLGLVVRRAAILGRGWLVDARRLVRRSR